MIPLYAVVLPVLVLFCGLSIDIGMLELKKLQMQSATDAAALGAELEAERGTNNWVNIGIAEAGVNGFTNGSNNTTVSIVEQATSGAYNGRYDAIQATITQSVNTIFMGAFNGGKFTLTTQSSALMTPCVYTLGNGTLQNQSLEVYTGSLLGDSCPIYATTLDDESSGNIAVESVDISGSSSTSMVGGFVYPSPVYNVPTLTDPLASTASPTAFNGTCNHTSYSITSGSATLNPGNYCKGLNISNATVTLNPGLYTITGGASWSGATVSGTGVTLFFTTGGGGGYGQLLVLSGSTVTLSAANDSSTGTIPATPAILVFADRNWTTTAAQDFQVRNSSFTGDGIWYIPKAGLNVWSDTAFTGTNYLGIVADNLFTGGTQIKLLNNYSYITTGNPFRKLGTLVQ
ncbi:pilus assembly protein TadG-related protein [Granulicella aggregans]|uniref:pilus assembly protein TadG-related protein n=1 Tax=Granulicella aggregans TaxID=474949 RepID=UPI0021DFED1A|nr:pilus assembly protein TadG-related protein [Granulicella aggregans]